ncbi:hypothetical protein BD769DRAFT_1394522 [Suillus cothurnatus]|nr:hypothetical protein BD769DRAFT_1394522 [Suillus cothurnatus]
MKSPAYILAILLDPVGKMAYFKWHWPEDLHDKVLTTAEKVFKAQYPKLNEEGTSSLLSQPASKKSKVGRLKSLIQEVLSDSEDDLSVNPTLASIGNPLWPWRAEFISYIETIEATLPAGMTTIQWWGFVHHSTFSQGGITVTKQQNRLKGDIIEALQIVKCSIQHNLLFRELGLSSLMKLEELNDAELEAGSDSKAAGDDGDDEDSWDVMPDDAEDDADDEADKSDFEMDD